ncbi:DUF6803 family protein [Chitinilyticum litopenaei]|uniref:DUF6803 family protein n=1 Tax=Chitinilyticum litopenaei TaxID=1121276 RepID=UPI00042A0337|nr:DUF6803 family protein [Chitinilyticum litopenaei]
MSMTHYMALLAANQPWNLLIFMAVPVILAETVAISELYLLFTRRLHGRVRQLNRVASILGGLWFSGIFVYLFTTAVIPLTVSGGWLGAADVIAVGFYLSGIVPLGGMALLDLGLLARGRDEEYRLRLHAILVAVFLVVAHVAMIFGMLDPALLMSHAAEMPGMAH